MWTKRISKERKRIVRTLTTNAQAKKEATVEVDLDREAEVEVVSVVETTDTKEGNQ